MVRDAEATARDAEQSTSNGVGMCLQWSRERAAIAALFPDAATAWRNAFRRHKGDRMPPRGAMVYWLGGSQGYGHIAVSLGGGKVRSSDANGAGRPATVELGWIEQHWGLPYAGWADNVNDVVIPGVVPGEGDEDMPQYDHATASKPQQLQPKEWLPITWAKNASGPATKPGEPGLGLGGRRYVATLHVEVDAPKGATIRLNAVEFADGSAQQTLPQVEVIANDGSTYCEYSHVGAVAAGRVLRFRAWCSDKATLANADVTTLSW